MLDEIGSRFENNLRRVRNLVEIFDRLSPEDVDREIFASDLLRASIVLLHAALEDLLRSLAEWKLPTAAPAALASVPLQGVSDPRRTRFTMPELAKHRGRSVDDVVRDSVLFYLERSSYNDPGDVKRIVATCGGNPSVVEGFVRWMGPIMRRRHWIVHRADHSRTLEGRRHEAQAVDRATVNTWIDKVEQLGDSILNEFR